MRASIDMDLNESALATALGDLPAGNYDLVCGECNRKTASLLAADNSDVRAVIVPDDILLSRFTWAIVSPEGAFFYSVPLP